LCQKKFKRKNSTPKENPSELPVESLREEDSISFRFRGVGISKEAAEAASAMYCAITMFSI